MWLAPGGKRLPDRRRCGRNGLYAYEKWVLRRRCWSQPLTGGSTLAASHLLFTGQEFPAHDLDFRRSLDANAKHATGGFENLDFYVLADPQGLARASHDHQQGDGSRRSATDNVRAPRAVTPARRGIGTMWLASLREENLEGDRPAQQDTLREQALAYTQAQLTDVAVAQWEAFSGQKGGPALSLPRSTPVSRSPR